MGPNLLYIHSDQHSPFVAGCYGDEVAETPHLDRLASRGVTLDNVYCPSPICVPSRMAMLTGRYPHENEVWTNNHVLDSGIPTFAHAMGAAGYDPILVGRMHSNGPDQLHGYAKRFVGDHGPNYLGGTGANHGMLSGTAGPKRVSIRKSGIGQSAYQVHDEDVTAATVACLDRLGVHRKAGVLSKPFSLSVGFMLPHQPFVARREDYERFAGRVPPPQSPVPFSVDLHPHFQKWREDCGIVTEIPEAQIDGARTAYWALVYRMDAMIGQILDALKENGFEDNTIVVYSSDHGEQVGEHGLWWKQTFYDDSARVPGIIAWPGQLPEGTRIDRVVSALDINATMIDALSGPPLPTSRGRSLLPLLRDSTSEWEDVAFSEYCTEDGCLHRMIRSGSWKLCYYHGQPSQLFNMVEDPREMTDRIDDPACSDIAAELTARVLDGWDPDRVWEKMQTKTEECGLLARWGRNVKPKDTHRWNLRPEMDYLE